MASNHNSRFNDVQTSQKYARMGADNSMSEYGHSYAMENPLYSSMQTAAGDPYTLNRAYNGHHVSNKSTDDKTKSSSRGVSDKPSMKKERAKKLRQLQFYIIIVIALTIILCLAFGLGFGLGYRNDDSAVSSRLEKENANKVHDATIRVVVEDIQWDSTMADIHSTSFKQTADVTERSMDSYFGKSSMAEIYDYAVVSELWQGSVGCTARIYLLPPTASTSQNVNDIYNSIRNGSGDQKLTENLKIGQDAFLSAPRENRVKFMFGTLMTITTTHRMDSTTTSLPTNTRTTASNVATSASSGMASTNATMGTISSGVTITTTTSTIKTSPFSETATPKVTGETATSTGMSVTTISSVTSIPTVANTTSPFSGTSSVNRTVETTSSVTTFSGTTFSVTSPSVTSPSVTSPSMTSPSMTSPNMTSPSMTSPNMTPPNITSSAMTSPSVTSPIMTSPGVTSPSVTSPSATSPSATSPIMTSLSATSPSATSPSATSPSATSPSVTSPSATSPSVTSPIMTSPSATSPSATSTSATSPSATSPTATSPNVTSIFNTSLTTSSSIEITTNYSNDTSNSTHGNKTVDLAVWVKLTVHLTEWNSALEDKTSSQFKYLSDRVSEVVVQTNFNITVLEIVSFNREADAVTASVILSILAYDKEDITTLSNKLKMSLEYQQLAYNMTFLDVISVEWVKDLTVVLKQTELWVWYDSKWNPACQKYFPLSAVDVVCRQLGYKHGLVYLGLFKENALNMSNIICNGSMAQTSLSECTNKLNRIEFADCPVTNMNCFNNLMKYELAGGDNTTYGYVRVKWDNKDGLLCSSAEHSDAMATYLCRDINSKFYGGSILQSDILNRPAEADMWQVQANCYRPETDSSFFDCVQSGWKFIQNVTYYSSSMKDDTEQLPFMPDPNACPLNTRFGTTKSPDKITDHTISDTCLVKLNCHSQPVAIYQGPFSNSGYIFATNSSDPLIFCRDNFTDLDATAACKSIGYQSGGVSLHFNPVPWFSYKTWKYSSYDYQCSENETIQECNKTEIDLSMHDCSGPAVVKCVDAAATYKDWDLKLDSDGHTVLLYYKGQWGTICDTDTKMPWSINEATVVCQELGYSYGVPRSLKLLPKTSLPHVITNVTCSNIATKLSNCSYNEISSDVCINSYAAKVFCYNSGDVAKLELLNATEFNSGFVKVTWQNVEGYLCTWSLDSTAATVMCRNFGFISGIQDTSPNFTDPHLQYIWQTDFNGQCNTNEVLPEICRSATWVKYASNLSHTDMKCVCNENYISLYCYGKVKVSLEPRKNYGPLFIYNENDYYSVCYDDLNQNAANAACREVTRLNTSNAVILYPGTFMHDNSKDVAFTCAEDAISVSECATFLSGFNFDCQVGSVLCYKGKEAPGLTPENATEWRIEGSVVQIKAYGVWGTVCSDGWTNNEATVLCRTINSEYTIGIAKMSNRLPTVPMWLSSVSCDLNVTDINACLRKTFLEVQDYCQFGEAATAFCFRGQSDVPKFMIADVDMAAFYEKGHLAVIRNGQVGYFCPLDQSALEFHVNDLCYIMHYKGGQISQVKVPKYEHTLVWNGSYDCTWNIPDCFLNGNFTDRTGINISYSNEASDTNDQANSANMTRNPCEILVPDILCFSSKVRLNNPESSEGFLLVYGQDGWQGVCTDTFTSQLAEKFCTEAGYLSGNYTLASASQANVLAGYGDVICIGDVKFEDCTFNKLSSELSQSCDEIVYLLCS